MKSLIILAAIFVCQSISAQIDYTKLIIGRNQGVHYLHDGDSTRIFGFAETLSELTEIPGPTIQVRSGDSVKIDFWNVSQGAPHTIHLHGLDVDQQNDGVGMLSFEVEHMEHGFYYFKAPHPGTYLYHCHVGSTVHLQAGMYGLVIVRPGSGSTTLNWDGGESYAREFSVLASEIDTVWHNDTILDHEHDSLMTLYVPENFKPQYFLLNGKSGTQLSDPANYYFALKNEKVYMRLANIGYYGTRFIFPASVNARTVASDGRPLPTEVLSDTVEVLPGERYESFIQLGTDQFYSVTVEHFNLNTQIVESTQDLVIQTTSVSLPEEKVDPLSVYPNPSNDVFYLVDKGELEKYSVYSAEGKLLLSSNEYAIDLSQYKSGIYFLNYKGNSYPLLKF